MRRLPPLRALEFKWRKWAYHPYIFKSPKHYYFILFPSVHEWSTKFNLNQPIPDKILLNQINALQQCQKELGTPAIGSSCHWLQDQWSKQQCCKRSTWISCCTFQIFLVIHIFPWCHLRFPFPALLPAVVEDRPGFQNQKQSGRYNMV
jgi:hypothetical protein